MSWATTLSRWTRAWLPFVASAALVGLLVHFALKSPWAIGALLVGAVVATVVFLKERASVREFFMSGAVDEISAALMDVVEGDHDASVALPLVRATALGAHGLTDRARIALDHADAGAASDTYVEHRLLLEVMLDALDGNADGALRNAEKLEQLALPISPWQRGRAATIRAGVAALARARAHRTRHGDPKRLSAAGRSEPLLYWTMRYGLAIVAARQHDYSPAETLLRTAPEWPEGSVFLAFNSELSAKILGNRAAPSGLEVCGPTLD